LKAETSWNGTQVVVLDELEQDELLSLIDRNRILSLVAMSELKRNAVLETG